MTIITSNVLFSIHPKWTYKILIGTKLIEIRKRIPKVKLPFTAYIYCTLDKKFPLSLGPFGPGMIEDNDPEYNMQGKVVGEFTCPEILEFTWDDYNHCYDIDDDSLEKSKLTQEELYNYGKGATLYGIVISNVITYDKPRDLDDVRVSCPNYSDDANALECWDCPHFCHYIEPDWSDEYKFCMVDGDKPLTRPPQSWQYVKEVKDPDEFQRKYTDDPELQRAIEELFS